MACFYEDDVNFSLMVYLINEDGCEPNNGGLASPKRVQGQPHWCRQERYCAFSEISKISFQIKTTATITHTHTQLKTKHRGHSLCY